MTFYNFKTCFFLILPPFPFSLRSTNISTSFQFLPVNSNNFHFNSPFMHSNNQELFDSRNKWLWLLLSVSFTFYSFFVCFTRDKMKTKFSSSNVAGDDWKWVTINDMAFLLSLELGEKFLLISSVYKGNKSYN